jgi:2-keto-4-pentenoate hydratase/2-oxohepta-3-ene-1,7-dioic acid hydratase in catechol pathway
MRIIRYLDRKGNERYGALQKDGSAIELSGSMYSGLKPINRSVDVNKLLAPLMPANIFGIGLNYRRHAEEAGVKIPEYPVLFIKGTNTLQHPGDPIFIPTHLGSAEVDHECELAVVIGTKCKNVAREDALKYVLGYSCANDVSARDWQLRKGGGQWNRGKTFDSFCPLGPCLVTPDEIPDPNNLAIRTILNGEKVQDWNTNDMIFDVPALIEFLSGSTTLLPGTIILTGTPQGIGMTADPPRWLKPGDSVTIEIEKIGQLTNPVQTETVWNLSVDEAKSPSRLSL